MMATILETIGALLINNIGTLIALAGLSYLASLFYGLYYSLQISVQGTVLYSEDDEVLVERIADLVAGAGVAGLWSDAHEFMPFIAIPLFIVMSSIALAINYWIYSPIMVYL